MVPDHDRIESIFMTALEIESEAERRAYIKQACGEDAALQLQVEQLLNNHMQAGSFLNMNGENEAKPDSTQDNQPTQIGPYKLLQKIGEGGMGLVFLAEQTEPFQRQVALKVIRAGMDSSQVVARFEQERQALAVMDHPNIARVIDGGLAADGRPYFAMELIQGLPITEYCDLHRLTLRQRLELFVPVCQAVQHAHQKGIIHRDLKPSNVLVTEVEGRPTPKVIDFGVAKAVGVRLSSATLNTQLGAIIGTLEYMSPEQAVPDHEDIDTRSDIYCLGVLLFELLTGSTPLQRQKLKDVAVLELLRVIREEEPPKPSHRLSTIHDLPSVAACRGLEPKSLSNVVKGDLDWIVMKCLEKDRNRRYSVANAVARDIERFLCHEPIEAGPPGASYRMRKFLWRNRWATTVVTLLLLSLVGGMVGTSIGLVQAARSQAATSQALEVAKQQRDRAERHYQRALSAVDRLLTRVGGVRLETVPRMDETRRKILEDALEFYNEILKEENGDNAVRREVGLAWARVGELQSALGDDQAVKSLRHALDIQQQLLAEFPNETQYNEDAIRGHRRLAFELFRLGEYSDGTAVVDDILNHGSFTTNEARSEQITLFRLLAMICATTQKRNEAVAAGESALQLADALVQSEPTVWDHKMERSSVLSLLGNLYREGRKLEEAKTLLQEGKSILEQKLTESPSDVDVQNYLAATCVNLGLTYANLDRPKDAQAEYAIAVDNFESLARAHPSLFYYKWQLARVFNNVALLHSMNKEVEQAAKENEKANAVFKELMESHPERPDFVASYASSCSNQGKYLFEEEHWEESIVWNSKAIETSDKLLAIQPRHTETRRTLHGSLMGRAGAYRKLNQLDLAIKDYRRSLELSEGESHVSFVNFRPRALAFVGEHKQAAEAAEAIVESPTATDSNFSEMAKVYATCAGVVGSDVALTDTQRRELAEKYAVRTVELLTRAAEKGRFETLEDVADLRSDDRLKSLQNRDDLKKFLADLEQSIQTKQ